MQIVQHEYVHCIMSCLPLTDPHWYEEGLAEFLSSVTFNGDKVVVGQLPDTRVYSARRGMPATSFAEITADNYNVIEANRFRDEYAQYWAVVQYCMLDNHKRYHDLAKYLALRNLYGEGNIEAFKRAFHADPDTFWQEVWSYTTRGRYHYVTLSIKKNLKPVNVQERDASPEEIGACLAVLSHIVKVWRCELSHCVAADAGTHGGTVQGKDAGSPA